MPATRFVAYHRVSTDKQGRSGLGLDAQRSSIQAFTGNCDWQLVAEFVEVESGSNNERPQLQKALATCRVHNAILVIAKLDRLSRNAAFLLNLRNSGVRFVAADMPDANELTVGIMAVVAEDERRRISERTKAALASAKKRGVKLGTAGTANLRNRAFGVQRSAESRSMAADARACDLMPVIDDLREHGASSLRQIANGLNDRGITTPRGRHWSAAQVRNVLLRAEPN